MSDIWQRDVRHLLKVARHGLVNPAFDRIRIGETADRYQALMNDNIALRKALVQCMRFFIDHADQMTLDIPEAAELLVAINKATHPTEPIVFRGSATDREVHLQANATGRIRTDLPVVVERDTERTTAYWPALPAPTEEENDHATLRPDDSRIVESSDRDDDTHA